VEVNPTKLASYGLSMTNIQSVLRLQNSDLAKGQITDGITTATSSPTIRYLTRKTSSRSSSGTTMAPPSTSLTSPTSSTPCKTSASPDI